MGRRFYQPPNWLTTLLVVIFLFQEVTEMYDVLIVGAGPGGIFTAYELLEKRPDLRIAVFEMGNELKKRHCPIDGDKIKSCIHCKNCSIMSGFGGAGALDVYKRQPIISPSRITIIRSLIPINSGISDEIIIIAFPSSASWRIN